jgi:hypothetical protein
MAHEHAELQAKAPWTLLAQDAALGPPNETGSPKSTWRRRAEARRTPLAQDAALGPPNETGSCARVAHTGSPKST